jgi:hypothetical protein
MSGEILSMRKIREVLRLRLDQGLPQRAAAQSVGLSEGAVHGYVARDLFMALGIPADNTRPPGELAGQSAQPHLAFS